MNKYLKWILIGVGVLVVLGALGKAGNKTQKVGQLPLASASPKETIYKVGDQVKLKNFVIFINSAEESTGTGWAKPVDGNKWLNLNITLQNTGNNQVRLTTLGQMFVKDSEGNTYQVALTDKTLRNINNRLDGVILADGKRTGWVGFEVKENAQNLIFQFNANIFGGGNVQVAL